MDWLNTGFTETSPTGSSPADLSVHEAADDEVQAGTLAWGKDKALGWLKVLDEDLIGPRSSFLCGDDITIADYLGSMMILGGEVIDCKLARIRHSSLARQDEGAQELGEGQRGVLQIRGRPQQGEGIRAAVTFTAAAPPTETSDDRDFTTRARCRDSEETRRFWFPRAAAFRQPPRSARPRPAARPPCSTPYRLDDGSYPRLLRGARHALRVEGAARLRSPHALEVEPPVLAEMLAKERRGNETRGISGTLRALIYFRDERLRDRADREDAGARANDGPGDERARAILDRWEADKTALAAWWTRCASPDAAPPRPPR